MSTKGIEEGGEGHTEDERSPRTTAINAQSRLRASSVINNHGDVKGGEEGWLSEIKTWVTGEGGKREESEKS